MTATPRVLGGRYEVGELVGRGGMAEVHKGYDTRLSRPVAIKMLRTDLARDPSFLARFRREAQSAAGLNHASIVAVYDSGEDQLQESGGASVSIPYIVMEYVEGQTLRQLLGERSPLDPSEAAHITEGILDALAYSHRMGIVHRDIKPANVMIGSQGEIKVMDFGIARAVADSSATMTQTQAVIGTAQYLSPEQAQGRQVDARSDLYSTGCLLFELLTGRPPFQGDSSVAIAYQHVGEAPPRPSSLNPEVGPALDAVVLHALAKDRDSRYQDATSFRVDLRAARLGRPISAAARGTAAALGAAGGEATVAMDLMPRGTTTTVLPAAGGSEPELEPHGNTASLPPIGRDPDEEPGKRRGLAYVLLIAAVVGAVALLGLAAKGWLDRPPTSVAKVSVPSVVTLPEATAEAKVRAAGLVPKVDVVTNDAQKGLVVDQNPEADSQAARGSTVTLSVSGGPGEVQVPNVTGFTLAEAKTALENVDLKLGTTKAVNNTDVEKGKVVSTEPGADATAAVGSAVAVTVSSGKVTVPDLVGMTRDQAASALGDANLQPRTEYADSSEPENTVIRQSVPKGKLVDLGSSVTITVAKPAAPAPTTETPTPSPTQTTPSPTESSPTTTPTTPSPTTTTTTATK